MADRLTRFLEKYKFIEDKNQFSFRKKHMTTLAVIKYIQERYRNKVVVKLTDLPYYDDFECNLLTCDY